MVFNNPTFKAFKSTKDLGGIAANQYAKYTYREDSFCKNIGVFLNRVGYFLSHGKKISNAKMIGSLTNHVEASANAIKNGQMPANQKCHVEKAKKICAYLLTRVNDPNLQKQLNDAYKKQSDAYDQAIGAKKGQNGGGAGTDKDDLEQDSSQQKGKDNKSAGQNNGSSSGTHKSTLPPGTVDLLKTVADAEIIIELVTLQKGNLSNYIKALDILYSRSDLKNFKNEDSNKFYELLLNAPWVDNSGIEYNRLLSVLLKGLSKEQVQALNDLYPNTASTTTSTTTTTPTPKPKPITSDLDFSFLLDNVEDAIDVIKGIDDPTQFAKAIDTLFSSPKLRTLSQPKTIEFYLLTLGSMNADEQSAVLLTLLSDEQKQWIFDLQGTNPPSTPTPVPTPQPTPVIPQNPPTPAAPVVIATTTNPAPVNPPADNLKDVKEKDIDTAMAIVASLSDEPVSFLIAMTTLLTDRDYSQLPDEKAVEVFEFLNNAPAQYDDHKLSLKQGFYRNMAGAHGKAINAKYPEEKAEILAAVLERLKKQPAKAPAVAKDPAPQPVPAPVDTPPAQDPAVANAPAPQPAPAPVDTPPAQDPAVANAPAPQPAPAPVDTPPTPDQAIDAQQPAQAPATDVVTPDTDQKPSTAKPAFDIHSINDQSIDTVIALVKSQNGNKSGYVPALAQGLLRNNYSNATPEQILELYKLIKEAPAGVAPSQKEIDALNARFLPKLTLEQIEKLAEAYPTDEVIYRKAFAFSLIEQFNSIKPAGEPEDWSIENVIAVFEDLKKAKAVNAIEKEIKLGFIRDLVDLFSNKQLEALKEKFPKNFGPANPGQPAPKAADPGPSQQSDNQSTPVPQPVPAQVDVEPKPADVTVQPATQPEPQTVQTASKAAPKAAKNRLS